MHLALSQSQCNWEDIIGLLNENEKSLLKKYYIKFHVTLILIEHEGL